MVSGLLNHQDFRETGPMHIKKWFQNTFLTSTLDRGKINELMQIDP